LGGVRLVITSPVATVTFDGSAAGEINGRPTGPVSWNELAEVGRRITGDVRLVVIHLDGLLDGDASQGALGEQPAAWLRRADLVSVALVDGDIAGLAADLALMSDLRVWADNARLAITATQAGEVPTSALVLADLVGRSRALEMCLTGRWVHADEAASTGLATVVVPPGELDATTRDLVAAILAAPRDAVVEATALLRAPRRDLAEGWSAVAEAQQRLTVGKQG
jgi:enoyl-CoA hydratase/carnithine racemase